MSTLFKSILGLAMLAMLAGGAGAQTVVDPALTVQPVITSGTLSQPTGMVFLAANDLLVTEKATGNVRRVTGGVVQAGSVLHVDVLTQSERGLLGIALDPEFPAQSKVYLYYTAVGITAPENRVSSFTWNGTALTGEATLLSLPVSPGPNHDGGVIQFGPPTVPAAQRKLFGIIGDLNRREQAQNYATGAAPDGSGFVFRINRDGTAPSDNPFFSVAGGNTFLQKMYAYGIRNSFGLNFDPVSGALWDTENGENFYDEINRIDPAFNSGWHDLMGPTGAPNGDHAAPGKVQFGGVGTYSDPEFSWQSVTAPTAIHFLNSLSLGASYRYKCFVGSNNTAKLYCFKMNSGRTAFDFTGSTHGLGDLVLNSSGDTDSEILFGNGFAVPTDIETGPDGALWVLSLGNGQIYRIYDPLHLGEQPNAANPRNWEIYD